MCVLFFWVRIVQIQMVNNVKRCRVIREENNWEETNGFYN